MKKYKYKYVQGDRNEVVGGLNQFGQDGWELVGMPVSVGGGYIGAWMKLELEQDGAEQQPASRGKIQKDEMTEAVRFIVLKRGGISAREKSTLRALGITTLEELSSLTLSALMACPGCGDGTANSLIRSAGMAREKLQVRQ